MAHHLNKPVFPSVKDALCQVWLKYAQKFLRRSLNFGNLFLLFSNYLSLETGMALHSVSSSELKVGLDYPNISGMLLIFQLESP